MNTLHTATVLAAQNNCHHNISFVAVILLLIIINISAIEPLPDEIHQGALATIDLIYNENFPQAEDQARQIIKNFPDHPAGYFFMAVVLDTWSEVYQSNKRADEFYRYCDLATEKGELILIKKNKDDQWARFFIAGSDGYKGTFEARYEKWITAFRYGWKGVSVFLDLEKEKSSIVDINYGIGAYDYWRSAMIKVLWFMDKVEDRRNKAIERLFYSRKNGVYTKTTSSFELIDVLLNEKRDSEALEIAQELLIKYPSSTMALWGKARSLFGLKRYEEASEVFRQVLSKVESNSFDNHYTASHCHLWLAKIELERGNYPAAIAESNRVGYYDFEEGIRKRLENQFSEAKNIRKDAEAKVGK